MQSNIYIRDTLIRVEDFDKLSEEKQTKIRELVSEFNSIPYVDFRTEVGPNQRARMSKRELKKHDENRQRVWAIELEIKELLTPDNVKEERERKARIKELESIVSSCDSAMKRYYSYGRMLWCKPSKKVCKMKIGYIRALDDYQQRKDKALQELKTLK